MTSTSLCAALPQMSNTAILYTLWAHVSSGAQGLRRRAGEVHPRADGHGEDILGPRELPHGRCHPYPYRSSLGVPSRSGVAQVEKLFRQSAEFCSEHETWKLNVAHVFFMQVGLSSIGHRSKS